MRFRLVPVLLACLAGSTQAHGIDALQTRGGPPPALSPGSRICLMPVNVRYELSMEQTDVRENVDPTGDLANRVTSAICDSVGGWASVAYDLNTARGLESLAERCPGLDLPTLSPALLGKCFSVLPQEERPSHILTVRVLVKVGKRGKLAWTNTGRVPVPFTSLPGTSRTLFTATLQETEGHAEVWRREVQLRNRLDAAEGRLPEILRELFQRITNGEKKP